MTVYNAVSSNKRKSYIIVFLFLLFVFFIGYIFGKVMGYDLIFSGIILIFAGLYSFLSYYFSDKIVLSINHAKEASREEFFDLYTSVENLSIATGLPMPKVYVVNDPSPNAFATGRDPKHATVAVTTGLLSILNKSELEGVIAHELSHIKNFDTRLMGIVSMLVGFVAMLSDIFLRNMFFSRNKISGQFILLLALVFAIIAPIAATLMQLALSRKREFLADADGVLITRYPDALAHALEKIAAHPTPLKNPNVSTAHFYIENPFKEKRSRNWLTGLFNTHPPVEERIAILRSL